MNICISFLILRKIIILKSLEYFQFSFTDVIDIVLVAILLFYLYRLVKGTVAINILIGIIIIYIIWKITDLLKMDVLSNILGNFISVGFFALIVVFQQEIRKFLLLIGSPNFATRRNLIKYFNFLNQNSNNKKFDIKLFLDDCYSMSKKKTGAIIVIERENLHSSNRTISNCSIHHIRASYTGINRTKTMDHKINGNGSFAIHTRSY